MRFLLFVKVERLDNDEWIETGTVLINMWKVRAIEKSKLNPEVAIICFEYGGDCEVVKWVDDLKEFP